MLKKLLDFTDLPELSNDAKNLLESGAGELYQSKDNFVLVINSDIFLQLSSKGKIQSPLETFNPKKAQPVFLNPLTFSY